MDVLLLQTRSSDLGPYLLWLGVALAVLVAASVGVLWYRRRVLGPAGADSQAGLLDDLRAMRDRGEITPEEFDAAKRAMVARISGNAGAGSRAPRAGERRAEPGFDLTGQPLPKAEQEPPREPPAV